MGLGSVDSRVARDVLAEERHRGRGVGAGCLENCVVRTTRRGGQGWGCLSVATSTTKAFRFSLFRRRRREIRLSKHRDVDDIGITHFENQPLLGLMIIHL